MKPRLDSALYIGHLLLPSLLLTDILAAWNSNADQRYHPSSDKLILSACVLWLAAGILFPLFSSRREIFFRRLHKPLIAMWCVYGCLILCEIGLRVFFPRSEAGAALRPPGSRVEFRPSDSGIPVSGVSRFTVNEIGLRGPAVPSDQSVYRIITLGSSTTEDEPQDDSREWSHLLMQQLNERQSNVHVWIANAGVSGYTTVENLEEMKDLPIFSHVNAVIMVLGETDLGATLSVGGGSSKQSLSQSAALLRRSILAHGTRVFERPYYKSLRVYVFGKQLASALLGHFGKQDAFEERIPLAAWRKERAEAQIQPVPDLSIGLAEYRSRIDALVAECTELKVRCIFATQPTLWRADLSRTDESLLWGGRLADWQGSGRAAYASVSDLAAAMSEWNDALLTICAQEHLECFDLASHVSSTRTNFYDDAHTTDEGARAYADQLANYLLTTEPFGSASRSRFVAEHNARRHALLRNQLSRIKSGGPEPIAR